MQTTKPRHLQSSGSLQECPLSNDRTELEGSGLMWIARMRVRLEQENRWNVYTKVGFIMFHIGVACKTDRAETNTGPNRYRPEIIDLTGWDCLPPRPLHPRTMRRYNVLYIIYNSRCDLLGEVGGRGRMGQVGSSRDHILIKVGLGQGWSHA